MNQQPKKPNENSTQDQRVDFYRHNVAPQSNPLAGLSLEIQGIVFEILDVYGVTWNQIVGRKRPANIADPRHLIMAFLSWHSQLSLVEVGLLLGGRDHGTIIHARRKIAKLIETEPKVANLVFDLEERHLQIEDPSKVNRGSRPKPTGGFILPKKVRDRRNLEKKLNRGAVNSGTFTRGSFA